MQLIAAAFKCQARNCRQIVGVDGNVAASIIDQVAVFRVYAPAAAVKINFAAVGEVAAVV